MESVLSQFFSIQTIVFVLIVYLVTVSFRKVVEALAPKVAYVFPDKWEPWWVEFWREWVLMAAPSVIGGLIALFVANYPYPEVFSDSVAGRVFFGIIGGLACSHTYKFFNFYVKKLVPQRIKEEKEKLASEIEVEED